jgi:hypothetical protein
MRVVASKSLIKRLRAQGADMRECPECQKEMPFIPRQGHSLGRLHTVCVQCGYCRDCDEGE